MCPLDGHLKRTRRMLKCYNFRPWDNVCPKPVVDIQARPSCFDRRFHHCALYTRNTNHPTDRPYQPSEDSSTSIEMGRFNDKTNTQQYEDNRDHNTVDSSKDSRSRRSTKIQLGIHPHNTTISRPRTSGTSNAGRLATPNRSVPARGVASWSVGTRAHSLLLLNIKIDSGLCHTPCRPRRSQQVPIRVTIRRSAHTTANTRCL
jgi:hypothetical protein